MQIESESLDRAQVFLLYATFAGDVVRTAHAAGVRPVDVLRVADEEGWAEKLKPLLELQKSQKPGDLERALNRAVNWAQAHRMRLFLERVLHRVCGMKADEFEQYILQERTNKEGDSVIKTLSTRALADLATALEKCQAMTYLALNDTAQDRNRRKEQTTDGDNNMSDLHARIAKAMSQVNESSTPRAQLFDAQLKIATDAAVEKAKLAKPISIEPEKPMNPYDREN